MTSYTETQATSTIGSTFALAMGAAIASAPLHYPPRTEIYELEQVVGTYSSFAVEPLSSLRANDEFVQELAEIYAVFSARQRPLDSEIEAAIFENLESLYEA